MMSLSSSILFSLKHNKLHKKSIFSPLQYSISPKRKYLIYIMASLYGLHKGVAILNRHPLLCDYDNMNRRAMKRYRKEHIDFCLSIENCIMRIKEKKNTIIKDDDKLTFYHNRSRFLYRQKHYTKSIFFNYTMSQVIRIQKHIRGHLSRILFNDLVNYMIIQQSLKYIIYIQKCYRGHYIYKRTRENIIILHILTQRKSSSKSIENSFILYYYRNLIKRKILSNRIIEWELPYIIRIQNFYRAHYYHKLAKEIIAYEQRNYVLTYPFTCKEVKLRIYRYSSMDSMTSFDRSTMISVSDENYDVYSFEMCPVRKYYVVYIRHDSLIPGIYKCQFVVDGCVVCDGRFPIFDYETETFYNMIKFEIKNKKEGNKYEYNKYIDSI